MTKKLDCPASINVTRVVRFTEFKITGSISKHQKDTTSKKIRAQIVKEKNFGDEGFFFNLPSSNDHQNHLIGPESTVVEPIDPRVREKISSLVCRGERNPLVILKLVEHYVENVLQEFDRSRRRFYPDKGSVRTLISKIKSNLKHSPIDQENVQVMLSKWDREKHNVYFRPFINENAQDDVEEEPAKKKNLFFVYQSKEMSHLYRLYGNNCILLDATYKTCKYAIPLYFVVVDTNVNFQVVGVIISQFETKDDITEGLRIFRSWNEDVNPKYGMVDFAAEEIGSLEAVFPEIQVFICSFHREQAWSRWISKASNASIPKKEALMLLRKIANAATESDLLMAVDNLKKWSHFESSPLKNYFEGTWEKEMKRWATACKPADMYLNTNNGVERLNKELKYSHLIGFKGCSLSEMISVVCINFLPERYKKYVSDNVKISPMARKYDDSLPSYLHGRPKWIIDHVMAKIESMQSTKMSVTQISDKGHFLVSSASNKNIHYNIVFDQAQFKCSCDCPDFRRERLICKHILMVGVDFPCWSLDKINLWLFSNPIFQLDSSVLPNNMEVATAAKPSIPSFQVQNGEQNQLAQLKLRGSSKRHVLNNCRALMRSIESAMWNLNEENLEKLETTLEDVFSTVSSQVETDAKSGLPVESSSKIPIQKSVMKLISAPIETNTSSNLQAVQPQLPASTSTTDYGKLQLNKKRGFSGRVGCVADMMKAASDVSVSNMTPPGSCKRFKKFGHDSTNIENQPNPNSLS